MTWTQQQAVVLCRLVEAVAPAHGCHVALTGGLLYKDGSRKDCDLVLYRIRQVDKIDAAGLFEVLKSIGLEIDRDLRPSAFVVKAKWNGRPVDFLFPESGSGDYAADSAPNQPQPEIPMLSGGDIEF